MSAAFGTVQLRSDEAGQAAEVTLRRDLEAGTYRVTFRCEDGESAERTFEVTGSAKPVPSGGAETGGGGTSTRPDGGYVAGGLAAAGVAAGLGVVLIRRRRHRDAVDG